MTPCAQKLGAGLSWMLAVVSWTESAQKHVALLAVGMSVVLTGILIWNAILDNYRKRREERAAHRSELREIEEAACRARRQAGICPRDKWHPSTFDAEGVE